MDSEYDGSLIDLLKEIRTQINEAFDALESDELDEDTAAMVWSGLDSALEDVEYIIDQLS